MNTLSRFYTKYPVINNSEFDPYKDVGFENAIVSKKEFANLKLKKIEEFPKKSGDYLNHQLYIARYMSIYDELLLFHEPGTGKTCTAVAAIENLRNSSDNTIKRAVVLAKGEGLTKNFLHELMFTCTDGRYIPKGFDTLTEPQKNIRLLKSAKTFYHFHTFEKFASILHKMTNEEMQTSYENTIFVVDEVHNIHEDTTDTQRKHSTAAALVNKRKEFDTYEEFHRMFHVLKRRKIILMSGTPIRDRANEFAQVMNLILPLDNQLVDFERDYFTRDGIMIDNKRKQLAEIIKGRVSYLNSVTTDVKKIYSGSHYGDLQHFVVDVDQMSQFQSDVYDIAHEKDARDKGIYNDSRQASLFVFPDQTYGKDGYEQNTTREKWTIFRKKLLEEGLQGLERYSSKYYRLLNYLSLTNSGKHFVYCQYVKGSGLKLLAKIMEIFGYSKASGYETTHGKRYALCAGKTGNMIRATIDKFNSEDNVNGEIISVLLGSRMMNEGFTLKDISSEWILTPHWNYAEIAQAIARGWRLGSHNYKLRISNDVSVEIHQCVSMPRSQNKSIDLWMYEVSEKKDVLNRQIERLCKETSFDCALTFDRNKVTDFENQRECDYQSCEYTCTGSIKEPLDKSTYNLISDVQAMIRNKILERLRVVFANVEDYKLDNVVMDFQSEYDIDAIKQGVSSIIEAAELIDDVCGFPKFLRCKHDVLFLSVDPVTVSNTLAQFYTNVLLEKDISFEQTFRSVYEKNLDKLIYQVFAYPNLSDTLIVKLPYRVQRMILEACIISKHISGSSKNEQVRDIILKLFSGFYSVETDRIYVWLYDKELETTCYDVNEEKFVPCDFTLDDRRSQLKHSSIGWYGIVNPSIKGAFCLRNVTDKDTAKMSGKKGNIDLRKVNVGRQCVNTNKSILAGIAGPKMKLGEGTNDEEKKEYWQKQPKTKTCDALKEWFVQHDLIETNFDCGTSKKKRRNAVC